MDRHVLCRYDIRHIQSFLFSGCDERAQLGAGALVAAIIPEALRAAFRACGLQESEYDMGASPDPAYVPFFTDSGVLAQLISVGGGNATVLYRSGEFCRAVNRRFSRYVLEHTYCLQVDMAFTPVTGSFRRDYMELYRRIDIASNSTLYSHPLAALPIVETERGTGNPVCGFDEDTGEAISLETVWKRGRAPARRVPAFMPGGYAYIHIDGNDISLSVSGIMSSIEDYAAGIAAIRRLSAGINSACTRALDAAEERFSGRSFFQRLNSGGDDIDILCSADIAAEAVGIIAAEVCREPLWESPETGRIPVSVSAGVAVVPCEIPWRQGKALSGECCQRAKNHAKRSKSGAYADSYVCCGHYVRTEDGLWKLADPGASVPRRIMGG